MLPALLLLAAIANLSTQVPNPPSPRLTSIRALTCTFTVMATGTWTKGDAEASVKPAKLSVSFSAIDADDGTANAAGTTFKAHVTVRLVGNYLTFMQSDAYGATYLTTVFATETRPGRLQAVHTRHEYTPVSVPGFTSRPEQYYGECAVGDR
jgi:hypothetical protein